MRFITLIAFGVWVGLAFLIYQIKYETRDLDVRAANLAREVQKERANLAVARAEWNLASNPKLVEKLARGVLKLEPVRPDQIAGLPPAVVKPAAPADAIAALIERMPRTPGADQTHGIR